MTQRLLVLYRLIGQGSTKNLWIVLGGLTLVATMIGAAQWNGSGLELWNVAVGRETDREAAIASHLREMFSWWWLIIGFAYLLPVVLMPLSTSFSRDHVLWLRLTPCSPRKIALARACRGAGSALMLGGLGLSVAIVGAIYHDVSMSEGVWTVAGISTHVIWASGIVLIAGPFLPSPVDRALCAFFAFLVPIISFLVYAALKPSLPTVVEHYWPYVTFFVRPPRRMEEHTLAAFVIGLVGIGFSILIQPGKLRDRIPHTERR